MKKRLFLAAMVLLSFGINAQAAPVKDSTTKAATPLPVQIAPQPRVIIFWFTETEANELYNALGVTTYPFNKVNPLLEKMQYQYQHQPAPPAATPSVKDTLPVIPVKKPVKRK